VRLVAALPLTVLLLALIPAASLARTRDLSHGTLSVERGRGLVVLSFRGGVIGAAVHGRVTISDPVDDGTDAVFSNCDRTRELSDITTLCVGDDIRFRAVGGRWKVRVSGRGINLSAVGRGKVLLDGTGDGVPGAFDGFYSLNGEDALSLPDFPTLLPLAAP